MNINHVYLTPNREAFLVIEKIKETDVLIEVFWTKQERQGLFTLLKDRFSVNPHGNNCTKIPKSVGGIDSILLNLRYRN